MAQVVAPMMVKVIMRHNVENDKSHTSASNNPASRGQLPTGLAGTLDSPLLPFHQGLVT
jgi:hypothetical protein